MMNPDCIAERRVQVVAWSARSRGGTAETVVDLLPLLDANSARKEED
jgi:hypothetical protein